MGPRAARPDDSHLAMATGTLAALRQKAPDAFAGIVVSPDGSVDLLVTAVTPAIVRAIDDAQRASGDAVMVRLVEGMKHSHAHLERLRDEITARHAELESRGAAIVEWGVDERQNKVRVGVKGLTPQIGELVAREFSADGVYVFEASEFRPTRT